MTTPSPMFDPNAPSLDPPEIISVTVDPSITMATVEWTMDGDAAQVTDIGIHLSLDPDDNDYFQAIVLLNTDRTHRLTGLTPDTGYEVEVQLFGSDGVYLDAADASFRTLAIVIPPAPDDDGDAVARGQAAAELPRKDAQTAGPRSLLNPET